MTWGLKKGDEVNSGRGAWAHEREPHPRFHLFARSEEVDETYCALVISLLEERVEGGDGLLASVLIPTRPLSPLVRLHARLRYIHPCYLLDVIIPSSTIMNYNRLSTRSKVRPIPGRGLSSFFMYFIILLETIDFMHWDFTRSYITLLVRFASIGTRKLRQKLVFPVVYTPSISK